MPVCAIRDAVAYFDIRIVQVSWDELPLCTGPAGGCL